FLINGFKGNVLHAGWRSRRSVENSSNWNTALSGIIQKARCVVAKYIMAKKSANRNPTPANHSGRAARPRIFLGLFSLIVALLTAIAVMDYRPEQNHRFSTQVTENNMVGEFGATFAYYSILWTGVAAWLVPVWLVW